VRYTYSTNGRSIYGIDMEKGTEGEVPSFPTPDELWNGTFTVANSWRDRFSDVPFEDKGGSHPIIAVLTLYSPTDVARINHPNPIDRLSRFLLKHAIEDCGLDWRRLVESAPWC